MVAAQAQRLVKSRREIERFHRDLSPPQEGGLRGSARVQFDQAQPQARRQPVPVDSPARPPVVADQVFNVAVIERFEDFDEFIVEHALEVTRVALTADTLS